MNSAASGPVVRLLQEDYPPFSNLRRTLPVFTERTGIRVEVTFLALEAFWTAMTNTFEAEDPPFDVVCCDEILLMRHVRLGQVAALDQYVARDRYALDDFTPAALAAASFRGRLYGIPYTQMSNVLIYRRDLVERYGLGVPDTMDDLYEAALAARRAALAEGRPELYGITARGLGGCGHNFWIIGSTIMPAWGGRWYDPAGRPAVNCAENVAALAFYAQLLRDAGPPETPQMSFTECAQFYAAGGVVFFIDAATEAAMIYDAGGPVAERTATALVPAGPLGSRHAGLYGPPFTIPERSPNRDAAWELVKFLAAPEQIISDCRYGGFVEVARESVLRSPELASRFRPDLLETIRATRQCARGERPTPAQGLLVGDVIGAECARVLRGELDAQQALERAQERIAALGNPELP